MMDMFNNFMSQGNGISGLLGTSFADMFNEDELDPIYRQAFKVLSGS